MIAMTFGANIGVVREAGVLDFTFSSCVSKRTV